MIVDFEKWSVNNYADENQFQAASIMMISQNFPQFRDKAWHTRNELSVTKLESESVAQYKSRSARQGNQDKGKGVVAGIKDILIRWKGVVYPIELKQPNGRVSDAQERVTRSWDLDCPIIPKWTCYTLLQVWEACNAILKSDLIVCHKNQLRDQ